MTPRPGLAGIDTALERVVASAYGNDPVNWAASSRDGGTPGARNSTDLPGGNRAPTALFTASPPGGEAPLDVLLDASASWDLDGDIVRYTWDLGDGDSASGPLVGHTYELDGVYLVTLTVEDDDGAEDSTSLLLPVAVDDGGRQRPGDANQDGHVDLSDAIRTLRRLFTTGGPLPCDGDALDDGGNLFLFDVNADARVDLTDPVYLLNWLYRGGPAPALGTDCVGMLGCPDSCS